MYDFADIISTVSGRFSGRKVVFTPSPHLFDYQHITAYCRFWYTKRSIWYTKRGKDCKGK
jgi:hypothetical protein